MSTPPRAAEPPPPDRAGRSFGEEGRRLSYGGYLKIPELLNLQQGLSDAHDELLFIAVHQAYELWFKVLLFELETARDAIGSGDLPAALHLLRRVHVIERLLVEQVEVLETMAPPDFLDFRHRLAPASGFQSVQFREIEFLSGLKDERYLKLVEASPAELARLERRLAEPSLADEISALLRRRGLTPGEVLRQGGELFDLTEALLDHDEAFAHWRSRHVLMVERQIGSKPGTGGSSGATYLRGTLGKRFYPELWSARSEI